MSTEIKRTMADRAANALYQTFQAIAGDLFQCIADEKGKPAESIVMRRSEVIESVTACGYMGGYPEMYGNDKEAVAWLDKQDDKIKAKVCKQAFPHGRYGY